MKVEIDFITNEMRKEIQKEVSLYLEKGGILPYVRRAIKWELESYMRKKKRNSIRRAYKPEPIWEDLRNER